MWVAKPIILTILCFSDKTESLYDFMIGFSRFVEPVWTTTSLYPFTWCDGRIQMDQTLETNSNKACHLLVHCLSDVCHAWAQAALPWSWPNRDERCMWHRVIAKYNTVSCSLLSLLAQASNMSAQHVNRWLRIFWRPLESNWNSIQSSN